MTAGAATVSTFGWRRFLVVAGPGIVVMLADTDAGSVITAAQSGAQWGYRLLVLQFLLIPILYIVQELTVRLGAATGKGHAGLIRDTSGAFWAWFSVGTLIVSCIGALLTEFSGIAGVGALMGVPVAGEPDAGRGGAAGHGLHPQLPARSSASPSSSARFELVFLLVAWLAHPSARRNRRRPRCRFRSATRNISISPRPISARSSCRGWCSSSSPRSSRRG